MGVSGLSRSRHCRRRREEAQVNLEGRRLVKGDRDLLSGPGRTSIHERAAQVVCSYWAEEGEAVLHDVAKLLKKLHRLRREPPECLEEEGRHRMPPDKGVGVVRHHSRSVPLVPLVISYPDHMNTLLS